MKKALLLPTLIAAMAAGNLAIMSQDSSAIYKEGNKTWWTVEEMLDFRKTADSEIDERCGKDYECREELYFERLGDYNNQYVALERLEEPQFNITSINPEQETMKVVYFDQNPMMKRMGEEEHDPLAHIFIAWFDEIANPGEMGNYYYETPLEETFTNIPHVIYQKNAEEYPGGVFPVNQEFSLPITGSGIKNDPLGRLGVAVFAEQYNSLGFVDYKSCLVAPDYTSGTECRLMVSSSGELKYMPPRETILMSSDVSTVEEPSQSTCPTSPADANSECFDDPDPSEEEGAGDEAGYGSADETYVSTKDQADFKTSDTTIVPKAPNTGVIGKIVDLASELPWWIIGVALLNLATIVWLFLPVQPKLPKISKKSIDKVKNLR